MSSWIIRLQSRIFGMYYIVHGSIPYFKLKAFGVLEWCFQQRSEFSLLSGDTSSEAHDHKQLSCQNSVGPSCSDIANVRSRESGDRDGAGEPGDIRLRTKNTTTDNVRALLHSSVHLFQLRQE